MKVWGFCLVPLIWRVRVCLPGWIFKVVMFFLRGWLLVKFLDWFGLRVI